MQYLTTEQLIEINQKILNNAHKGNIGVLDQNGLESIIESPK